MGREVKFRAWVTEYADEESPGYMLDLPANKLHFDCEDGFVLAFGDPGFWACECYEKRKPKFEVMQFTGLKDKNGREIWEGDIIEGDLFDARLPTRGVVVYDDEHACYANKNEAGLTFLFKIDDKIIIGNIYENPDLLNV